MDTALLTDANVRGILQRATLTAVGDFDGYKVCKTKKMQEEELSDGQCNTCMGRYQAHGLLL